MALRLLEAGIRARLRSGVAITSMAQCVEELIENCIDAGATCVAVRVDISRFKVQVVDNGNGISSSDLKLVGERYATSKCHSLSDLENLQYFGFRGEALASIVDVSGTVEICSRHKLSQQSHSKVFHRGRAVSISLNKNPRPSVGTTVTVHDFFYNLPVRRNGISVALELNQVRKVVECIALVNPSRSFSVRNDKTGECILQMHKTHSILSTFGLICGTEKASSMKEVAFSHSDFKVTGFISTDGHHSKSLQFIYVNGRLVKKTALHACVNSLLANSIIARKLSKQSDPSWHPQGLSQDKDLFSPKRAPEKHGVYVLMIECPRTEYDICLEPAKTLIEFRNWDNVLNTMELLVKKFLVENNLTLGPNAPDERSNKDTMDSETTSPCIHQPLETSPSQDTSKFLGGELKFNLEFRNALQSRVIRRKPLELNKEAPNLKKDDPCSEPEIYNYADKVASNCKPSESEGFSSQPSDPSSLASSPGMNRTSDRVGTPAGFEVDSTTGEGDSLNRNENLQEVSESVPISKEGKYSPKQHDATGEHLANFFSTESDASETVHLPTIQLTPAYKSAIPTIKFCQGVETEQQYNVSCQHCVGGVQSRESSHSSMVYSQPLGNNSLSASVGLAVAAQSFDQDQTHNDVSASQGGTGIYTVAESSKSSLLSISPASLFLDSIHTGMPSLTTTKPMVERPLLVGSYAESTHYNEYSSIPVWTSSCNRTLLPSCTFSCQSHPSTFLAATASVGQCGGSEPVEPHPRPLVGLETPIRSPLQSSSLSSKLMELLKKGKLAQKQELISGKQGVNIESKWQRKGMQNDPTTLSSCDGAASSVTLTDTLATVSCNSTTSNADSCYTLQASDCVKHSFNRRQEVASRQSCNPDESFSALSVIEPTQSMIGDASNSMLGSRTLSFSNPNIQQSKRQIAINSCLESTVLQSAQESYLSICGAKSTALCNHIEHITTIHNARHSNTRVASSADSHAPLLGTECLSHTSGSENDAQAFCPNGSREHTQSLLYHSDEINLADDQRISTRTSHVATGMLVSEPIPSINDPMTALRYYSNPLTTSSTTSGTVIHLPSASTHTQSHSTELYRPHNPTKGFAFRPIPEQVVELHNWDDSSTNESFSDNSVYSENERKSLTHLITATHREAASSSLPTYSSRPIAHPSIFGSGFHGSAQTTSSTTFHNSYSDPIACVAYSMSQSVLPHTGNYQMPNLSSAIVMDNSTVEDSTWSTASYGSSRSHSALKPQWKEATDPVSRQKVYIDSATGKCFSQKPTQFTSSQIDDTVARETLLGKRTDTLHSITSTTSSLGQFSSSSLGAPPLRAAPHLSHDFSPLLPRPKHQRTSFSQNSVSLTQNSSISNFVAEHMSERAVDSKWRNDDELSQLRISQLNEPSSVARLLETWENPTFQPGHEDVLNIGHSGSSRSQIKVHNTIYPYKFTREMFTGIKVLGQVDDKFIACLMDARNNGTPNLLVLIDQHAAHERVRLEALTADLYEAPPAGSTSTTNPRIKSSLVHPPLALSLQPVEKRLARLFRTQLETIGVSLLFQEGGVQAASIPSVLMEREASERKRGRPAVAHDILQELIVKHLELLQTTAGSCFTLPSTITQVLNSQACHGAIKFGDPLTPEECQSLIQQLSQCRLPFQCAHGRPALMPILDLELLNRRYYPQEVRFPDLKNIIQESDNKLTEL